MPSTIITKNGSGAPLAADLVAGELAVDLTNGRLYTEDTGGSVIEIGLNPSGNVDVTGTVTADGLTLGADDKIQFGSSDITGLYRTNSGNDLTLQHWGNASVLIDSDNNDSGTRSFLIGSNSQDRSTATSIAKFEDGGDISFYEDTGTTAKLFWDASAESLGIGTASPTRELEVTGTGNVYVKVTAPTATDSTALELANTGETWTIANDDTNSDALEFRTTGGTHLTVDTSGNVGIGTISPDSVLHLFGNTSAANIPRIKIEASGWSNDCRIERSSGSDGFYITNNYDTSASSADNSGAGTAGLQLARGFAAIHTGASGAFEEALRIDSSGNTTFKANNSAVGPIVTLENTATAVNGQAWGSIHFDSNDTSTSASGTRASIVGTSTSFNGDGNLDFYTAPDNGTNTFAMRIDSSGDVSIGDVSAEGAKLHIRTSNATTYNAASASGGDGVNLIVHNDNATANTTAGVILRTQVSGSFADARINNIGVSQNNSAMTFHTEGSGTVAERMRIDSSGSLLVGTTSFPSGTATTGSGFGWTSSGYKVQNYDNAGSIAMNFLNATSYVSGTVNFMTFRVNGSTKGSITSNGTTTAYNTSSDQRLKENIVDAPSASDDIDAIQVRSFDWKADGSHQKYGMVAQELVTVAPEAVSQPEDPEEMMGVDYSKLVPMMLKEIQQLRARVAQLEGAN